MGRTDDVDFRYPAIGRQVRHPGRSGNGGQHAARADPDRGRALASERRQPHVPGSRRFAGWLRIAASAAAAGMGGVAAGLRSAGRRSRAAAASGTAAARARRGHRLGVPGDEARDRNAEAHDHVRNEHDCRRASAKVGQPVSSPQPWHSGCVKGGYIAGLAAMLRPSVSPVKRLNGVIARCSGYNDGR